MQKKRMKKNANKKNIKAFMKIKSFVSSKNPDKEEVKKYEKKVNDFLSTVDNKKRFLNGRNSYAIGERIHTMIWYLERIPNEPISTPFGEKGKNESSKTKEKKNK